MALAAACRDAIFHRAAQRISIFICALFPLRPPQHMLNSAACCLGNQRHASACKCAGRTQFMGKPAPAQPPPLAIDAIMRRLKRVRFTSRPSRPLTRAATAQHRLTHSYSRPQRIQPKALNESSNTVNEYIGRKGGRENDEIRTKRGRAGKL